MKIQQLFKNKIVFVIAMIAIFIPSLKPVYAQSQKDLTISLERADIGNKENHQFELFYISDERFSDDSLTQKLDDFEKLDLNRLKKLYKDSIESAPTDKDGITTVSNLKNGTYYVREINGLGDKSIKSFFVRIPNDSNNIVYPKISEKREDDLLIKKTDEDGKALKGAKFKLFKIEDGKKLDLPLKNYKYDPKGSTQILVSNQNGEIGVENLPHGDYLIEEIEPPQGYEITDRVYNFKIDGVKINNIRVINKKTDLGGYQFIKTDGNDGSKLEGAVFKLTSYDKKTETYKPIIKNETQKLVKSDDKGFFKLENLPFGNYALWEVRAPDGYKPLNNAIKFTINKDSFKKKIDIRNYPDQARKEFPKTGNILLFISIISGAFMVVSGLNLIKQG